MCGVFVQGGVGVAWLAGQGRAEAQAPVLGSCVALSFPHLPTLSPLPTPHFCSLMEAEVAKPTQWL